MLMAISISHFVTELGDPDLRQDDSYHHAEPAFTEVSEGRFSSASPNLFNSTILCSAINDRHVYNAH